MLQQRSLQRKRSLETDGDSDTLEMDGDSDTSAEDSDLVKWCVARDKRETLKDILAMANAWMQQTSGIHKHLPELQYGELKDQASRWLSHHNQHRHPASPWRVAVCVSLVVSWLVASQLLRDPGL